MHARFPLIVGAIVTAGALDASAVPGDPDDLPSHHALPSASARFQSVRDVPWRNQRYQGAWRHPERWYEHLRENVVRVRNGRFDKPRADYLFEVRSVTVGDLDGDGAPEAAVVTFEAMGREYMERVWLYGVRDRRLVRLGEIGVPMDGVDRAYVNSIAIAGGRVVLRRSLLGTHDPSCCPGRDSEERWRLEPSGPVLDRIETTIVSME